MVLANVDINVIAIIIGIIVIGLCVVVFIVLNNINKTQNTRLENELELKDIIHNQNQLLDYQNKVYEAMLVQMTEINEKLSKE